MTREHLKQYFPDIASFFNHVSETHVFWQMIGEIDIDRARNGDTLLTDLEQVFSTLHDIDGHHVLKEQLENIKTKNEMMAMLTRVYIAYLYRSHSPRLVNGKHGYDIELEIADQLLALGVVSFRNFMSLHEQFRGAILDEMVHLESMKDQNGDDQESTAEFMTHLKTHAEQLSEYPKADHQLMAAITDQGVIDKEMDLAKYIREAKAEMQDHFSHVAGIILIDPTPGCERAKYVPFHGDDSDLEALLTRHG